MSKNLVIVESPAKAKTIEKFLGSDFKVKSSFGHIRDLPKKGISIDIDNNFEPTYEISADKKKVVSELKKDVKAAETVWLASDEDREGEAIAWHLCKALGLDDSETKRIVFHEITETAIKEAIKNPRTVDKDLVDAQQARRILDRLVGYKLSPVLWKKVRPGLSAGRVQSVAVRLIVEREREISAFNSESTFKVTGEFIDNNQTIPAELNVKLKDENAVKDFLEACKSSEFKVSAIDQKPSKKSPSAPFTTSSLQQEASRRLSFSVKQTMTLAQRLYESGHITYMRTDSTNLSGQAIKAAESYIVGNFGKEYHEVRQYKTKNSSAQEAHEAIRPTDFNKLAAGADESQKRLYKLIWQRALASQMAQAITDKTVIDINISNRSELFNAKGEILKFDGFMKVYGGTKDDVILPNLQNGQILAYESINARQSFSKPPARYSEASLVKKLEDLGIGRPSTYAPTISTIQARGYVEKSDLEGNTRQVKLFSLQDSNIQEEEAQENYGADKSKLLPTPTADVTTDFLVKHFPTIVDFDFTAKVEEEFDIVAEGKEPWQQVIRDFYTDFEPLVEKSESISREESTQTRHLGTDPKSGKPVMARYGRFGPMLQIGETESEEKPKFAPLPSGAKLETVTLDEALEMFKLPRTVGLTEDGKEIKANIGRFGPYIQVDKLFVSIKPFDPFEITEEEALKLYAEKLEKEANKYISEFESGVKVVNGPYSPYVTDGKKNARIPKDTDAKQLTEDQCKELLAKAPAKKRGFKRKKASK
jgi:DNA topoisomerase-1